MLRVSVGGTCVVLFSVAFAASEPANEPVSKDVQSEVVAVFSDQLKDPESLQLRNLHTTKLPGVGYDVVCGEYNAKNGYGGYVGFQPFQYVPKFKRLIEGALPC